MSVPKALAVALADVHSSAFISCEISPNWRNKNKLTSNLARNIRFGGTLFAKLANKKRNYDATYRQLLATKKWNPVWLFRHGGDRTSIVWRPPGPQKTATPSADEQTTAQYNRDHWNRCCRTVSAYLDAYQHIND
jgi:hypothetical protein